MKRDFIAGQQYPHFFTIEAIHIHTSEATNDEAVGEEINPWND